MMAQMQAQAAAGVPAGAGDGVGAYHRAAVHLPELFRVQTGQQFLERGAYQVFLGGGAHAHVFVGRFQEQHLGHGHHVDLRALAGLQHLQPRRGCGGQVQQRPQLGQRGVHQGGGRGCGQPLLQPLHRAPQPFGLYGLEQIVRRLGLEGLHRVLVVGGDEHQCGKRAIGRPGVRQFSGRFKSALARHAYVEEQHIRLQRQGLLHGGDAVQRQGGGVQFGPCLGQGVLQAQGQQGFVFGNQGAEGHGEGAVPGNGNTMVALVPPVGTVLSSRVAALPYRPASRSRTCCRPKWGSGRVGASAAGGGESGGRPAPLSVTCSCSRAAAPCPTCRR